MATEKEDVPETKQSQSLVLINLNMTFVRRLHYVIRCRLLFFRFHVGWLDGWMERRHCSGKFAGKQFDSLPQTFLMRMTINE